MRAIEIIDHAISFHPTEQAERRVKKYFTLMNALKVVLAVVILGDIALGLLGVVSVTYGAGIALIPMAVYLVARHSFAKKMRETLDNECDPVAFCDAYYALLSYSQKRTAPTEGIRNFCRGLLAAGKYADCASVLEGYKAELATPLDELRFCSLQILYAYEIRNESLMAQYCEALEELKKTGSVPQNEVDTVVDTYLERGRLLELESKKDLATLMDIYQEKSKHTLFTTRSKVEFNYRLALVAQEVGEHELAEQCLSYVARNGNTMYVAKEARRIQGGQHS